MPSVQMGGPHTPFAGLVIEEKTADYVAVSADFRGGVLISMNLGSANTLTVNSGLEAFRPLTIVNEGSGLCTITAGAGVTLKSPGAKLRLTERYAWATITRDPSAADTYWVVGGLA